MVTNLAVLIGMYVVSERKSQGNFYAGNSAESLGCAGFVRILSEDTSGHSYVRNIDGGEIVRNSRERLDSGGEAISTWKQNRHSRGVHVYVRGRSAARNLQAMAINHDL